MCIVPGPEGECHGSLVERLTDALSRAIDEGGGKARIRTKRVRWQYAGPPAQRFRRLATELAGAFETSQPQAPGEVTAAQFRASFRGSPDALAVVQHHLAAAQWDLSAAGLLVLYRRFWAATSDPSDIPVVVFVKVVYPPLRADANSNRVPLGARILWRARMLSIWMQLRFASRRAGCPCLLLDELKPIRRQDLDEWMVNNQVFETEQERVEALDDVFPPDGDESRVMAFIERYCGGVLDANSEESPEAGEEEAYAGRLAHQ
jgi:hypothetical protein